MNWLCFASAAALACVARITKPLEEVDRDLWSFMFRSVTILWFNCILWRSDCSIYPLDTSFSNVVTQFGPNQCLPTDIQYFPIAQIVFYVAEIGWLLTRPKEQLRKDDTIMVAHHVITSSLIAFWGVYYQLYWLATFLPCLHDASDLFIDYAKYAKRNHLLSLNGLNILFALFVGSWVSLRMYYIPGHMLPSLWYDPAGPLVPYAYFGFGLLIVLQFAQAFWTYMIGLAIVKAFQTGEELDDQRENETSDDKQVQVNQFNQ